MSATLAIRPSTAADRPALARLAALDSQPVPGGLVLLAEEEGRLVAALGVDGRGGGRPATTIVADPFRYTAEARAVLAAAAASRRGRAARSARRALGRRLALRARAA
jgi:hypothetical protein